MQGVDSSMKLIKRSLITDRRVCSREPGFSVKLDGHNGLDELLTVVIACHGATELD